MFPNKNISGDIGFATLGNEITRDETVALRYENSTVCNSPTSRLEV